MGAAQGWQEPERGSATRSDLMNAIRPHAEWALGAPVEFVVNDLRVAGGIAFASLAPQRPGGAVIDPARTPAAMRGQFDPIYMDGVALQVLYVQSGALWVALHWEFGATDVWWADPSLCLRFSPVIPEVC
ncbi:hypothetical protein ACMU_09670 [Actibacterium mucosum KCTC 23349]|uniref:Uncharacterized protein n=2 Tax=Actibacterium TaxID=1433986 RepID=A0A037ZMI8_9RHOB|nr:hypothetical protein ACMU_09670 [Actibacterium mucosum KCTC 23349]